jgi:FPC/CPF motif-containing protein YcgG
VERELEGEHEEIRGLVGESQASLTSTLESRCRSDFLSFVGNSAFPCLAAKAALNARSFCLRVYSELASPAASETLAKDLESFVNSELTPSGPYATFVAIFEGPLSIPEEEFERLLWSQLELLSKIDLARNSWDPRVSSDPSDPSFSFSFGGRAVYVVGMHGNSSRLSRRFRWPALVFNPHEQFQRLRANGQWTRLRGRIRERDIALQGSTNPMLSDFGDQSEAVQYSGRVTGPGWSPPAQLSGSQAKSPRRCPFAH